MKEDADETYQNMFCLNFNMSIFEEKKCGEGGVKGALGLSRASPTGKKG